MNGRDNRTLVGDRAGWEPVDEETKTRFADIVSPGALRLDYRAELRNRGAEGATVRAWRWWVADAWDRSYHYLPLESRLERTRVGEECKERPLEEGEAFTVPAGDFATLSFEGLSSLRRASGRAGPRGARRGPRCPSAERATTLRRGRSTSGRGRSWGLRRRWHAPGCPKGEP